MPAQLLWHQRMTVNRWKFRQSEENRKSAVKKDYPGDYGKRGRRKQKGGLGNPPFCFDLETLTAGSLIKR